MPQVQLVIEEMCNADLRDISNAVANGVVDVADIREKAFLTGKAYEIHTNQLTVHAAQEIYRNYGGWE